MPVLMELLAIRLGYQKTIAKSLVMSLSKRPVGISNIAGSTRKDVYKRQPHETEARAFGDQDVIGDPAVRGQEARTEFFCVLHDAGCIIARLVCGLRHNG